MKAFLTAAVSGLALLGLAACSEGDNTTTQSVEPTQDTAPLESPSAAPEPQGTTQPDGTTSQ